MVADEPEVVALRENCGLILQRTVLEVVYETTCDPIAANDFGEIAFSNNTSFQCAEH
jgi:hypothetical protein